MKSWLLLVGLAFVAGILGEQDLLRIQNSPVFSNLDSSSSGSGGQYKAVGHSSSSLSSGGGGSSYGDLSGEVGQSGSSHSSGRIPPPGYGTNSFDGGKQLNTQQGFTSEANSYEFAGTADGTGGYPSAVYPGGPPSPGGYPSTSATHVSHAQHGKEHGVHQTKGPAYTYYYQHYPAGNTPGHDHGHGHTHGHGHGQEGGEEGLFEGGDLGGNFGPLAGIGGIKGLKGLGVLGVIAKGVLALKPFLILGLLFLIAFPVLLFFIPLPIITISGSTNMTPGEPSPGGGRSGPTMTSYLTSLSEKVLSAEECLERVICKMPQAPETYQKKMRSLWDQYGSGIVKNSRVTRGLNAYFDSSSSKNRNFKCNQRFRCSNKFL